MQLILPVLGIALCGVTLFQFGLWVAASLRRMSYDNKQFQLNMQVLRQKLDCGVAGSDNFNDRTWIGYRKFLVQNISQVALNCSLVEIVPEDGLPLPMYFPGQFLTIKFHISGQSKPVVRCYSLCDSPSSEQYKFTVKAIIPSADDPDSRPGIVSHYVNEHLNCGDLLDVKAPTGAFYMDLNDTRPAVLLGGGIGITPLMSMIKTVIDHSINRELLLIFGVANSEQHPFKKEFEKLSADNPRFHVINCYSHPLASDRQGVDYHIEGIVSIDLIKQTVPSQNVPFYLCGPPTFMESLFSGLTDWGVTASQIHHESFGPTSVKRLNSKRPAVTASSAAEVDFAISGCHVPWESETESILELAEANEIEIDSGCRAGNCGTCQVRILAGDVEYPENMEVDCEPGNILSCIARPNGNIRLDV